VTEVGKASFDVVAFLREMGRMAQVASVSPAQTPLLGSLWYLFDDGKFWFSSARSSALPRAAERGLELAVIVDEFNPPLSIRQVRVRGHGRIEPHDPDVVHHIYERYLGLALDDWPQFFRERLGSTDGWALWSVSAETGMAVTSPAFAEEVYRWNAPGDAPFA
jgi:pyridoxamine 5'-phosphate oxidase-like protein